MQRCSLTSLTSLVTTGLSYPDLVHELLLLFMDEEVPGLKQMIHSVFSGFASDQVGQYFKPGSRGDCMTLLNTEMTLCKPCRWWRLNP